MQDKKEVQDQDKVEEDKHLYFRIVIQSHYFRVALTKSELPFFSASATKLTDQELILSLQEKSETAFRTLVGQYQDRVYNTCLGLLQNSEEAEEAAQDVFIEIYKSIEKFRGDSKLSTWIYRIATTKSLERIRKRKTQKRFAFLQSLTGGDQDYETTQHATFDHPGVILENKEHAQMLFKTIKELPESQRVAFTLHKVEGLPYQEIAEVLETSVSSVESLMFRARKNLQKKLKSYYEKNFVE